MSKIRSAIGPHEGIELELMLAGRKPLAMFTEVHPIESGIIPEEAFSPYVASGQIVKREVFEPAPAVPGHDGPLRLRRVLYSLPEQAWRIDAMLLLCQVYMEQSGWDVGLERVTGKLLGYDDEDIEAYVRNLPRAQEV